MISLWSLLCALFSQNRIHHRLPLLLPAHTMLSVGSSLLWRALNSFSCIRGGSWSSFLALSLICFDLLWDSMGMPCFLILYSTIALKLSIVFIESVLRTTAEDPFCMFMPFYLLWLRKQSTTNLDISILAKKLHIRARYCMHSRRRLLGRMHRFFQLAGNAINLDNDWGKPVTIGR